MPITEQQYMQLFNNRDRGKEAHKKWVDASFEILESYYTQADKNFVNAVSAVLDDGWQAPARNAFAYAGFCFWHRPLWDHVSQREGGVESIDVGKEDVRWKANKEFCALLKAPSDPKRDTVIADTEHHLAIATLAFRTVTRGDNSYEPYREKIFCEVLRRLTESEILNQAVQKWPCAIKENGEGKPDFFTGYDLAPFVAAQIRALKPNELAKELSSITASVARTIYPEIYGDLPEIRPNIADSSLDQNARNCSGSYNTDPRNFGYFFKDNCRLFVSFADFLAPCFHETEHLLQSWFMRKGIGGELNPFQAERLSDQDLYRMGSMWEKDCALNTCPPREARNEPALLAYYERPTEFFAHQTDRALTLVLSHHYNLPAWGVSPARKELVEEFRTSKLMTMAESFFPSSPKLLGASATKTPEQHPAP